MAAQKLTAQQRRIIKMAKKSGVLGFTGVDLFTTWDVAKWDKLSQEDLDDLEGCLYNLDALVKSFRGTN